jgi:hypothetical protein
MYNVTDSNLAQGISEKCVELEEYYPLGCDTM